MHFNYTLPICAAALLVAGTQTACYRSSSGEYGRDDTTRVATTMATTDTAADTTTDTTASTDTIAANALTDVEWTLVELNGTPAAMGARGKPANLTLSTKENRASGFAGCNRMMGTYTLKDNELRFSPMAMTMMACEQGMDLEMKFAAALEATRTYRVANKQLELMSGDMVLARLTRK